MSELKYIIPDEIGRAKNKHKNYLYNPNENIFINIVKIISNGTNMLIIAAQTINGPNGM